MNSKKEFPVVLRRDSVAVKIYRSDSKGFAEFTLAYREQGRRIRRSFTVLKEAQQEAKRVLTKLSQGTGDVLILRGTEKLEYTRAKEALTDSGQSLDWVTTEYARLRNELNGRGTLAEAVAHFVKTHHHIQAERQVIEVVKELVETRKREGSSQRHVDDLESRLMRFAAAFQCGIGSVAAGDIQDYLLALKLAPRTKNNFRMAISNLFGFARLRGYLAKDYDPVDEVPEFKEPQQTVEIYTPDELLKLIENCSEAFLPYVVIGAFAGLRQSEIQRLLWTHVGEKYIRVPPASEHRAKSVRLVELRPNLKEWLVPLRKAVGPVVPYANVCNPLMRLCAKAGVQSRHNALRHSYGSYRLAVVQDPAKVAFEMGNSANMVMQHYREVVTPEVAAAVFSIRPSTAPNVVRIDALQGSPTQVLG